MSASQVRSAARLASAGSIWRRTSFTSAGEIAIARLRNPLPSGCRDGHHLSLTAEDRALGFELGQQSARLLAPYLSALAS